MKETPYIYGKESKTLYTPNDFVRLAKNLGTYIKEPMMVGLNEKELSLVCVSLSGDGKTQTLKLNSEIFEIQYL